MLLWDKLVGRSKVLVYYRMAGEGIERGLDPAEAKQIAGQIVNDNFGGQEWIDSVFKNPQFRWSMMQLFLALDWTWSRVKMASWPFRYPIPRSLLPGGKGKLPCLRGAKTKKGLALQRRFGRRYWLRTLLGLFLFGEALNLLIGKKHLWENRATGSTWTTQSSGGSRMKWSPASSGSPTGSSAAT